MQIEDAVSSIFKNKTKKVLVICLLLTVWVVVSGVGGFVWQNRVDHLYRNALFMDLFNYSWPAINTEGEKPVLLCYYLGYWLPSAFVAKIVGNIYIGYVSQLLFGVFGVILSFFLVSIWLKRVSYITLFVFILFSGLDILTNLFFNETPFIDIFNNSTHIELILWDFNSSSNTTLLFWLYNQCIPFWISFMLLIIQKKETYMSFIFSLSFLFSPFPLLALVPLFFFVYYKSVNHSWLTLDEKLLLLIRSFFSLVNIFSLIICLIIVFYYKSNLSANQITVLFFDSNITIKFFFFLLFEYGVFIFFIWDRIKKDQIFWILFCTMICCSFIKMGTGSDFAWRTCMPASFYLMLKVIEELLSLTAERGIKRKVYFLSLVLFIGALTPFLEIKRTITHTLAYDKYQELYRIQDLASVFYNNPYGNPHYGNFVGKSDSFFYKYIMKRP